MYLTLSRSRASMTRGNFDTVSMVTRCLATPGRYQMTACKAVTCRVIFYTEFRWLWYYIFCWNLFTQRFADAWTFEIGLLISPRDSCSVYFRLFVDLQIVLFDVRSSASVLFCVRFIIYDFVLCLFGLISRSNLQNICYIGHCSHVPTFSFKYD